MLATKNIKGCFFHSEEGEGTIVEKGQRLNGGGFYAFPVGRLEFKDDPEGAINWKNRSH